MTSTLESSTSPEEQELARYLAMVETKKRRVAEAQTELEALKDALARFNAEYHARVGVWLAEANRLEREAEEYRFRLQVARQEPLTPAEDILERVEQVFRQQRQRQQDEEQQSRRYRDQAQTFRDQPKLDDHQETRLKRQFRELAKRFHPDLARTDDELIERTRRMQAVTDAFHRRDLEALERLALSDDIGSITFNNLSIAERLVWAIREVARLDQLLRSLEAERQSLIHTAMYRLFEAQRRGEDPLGRLEQEAKQRRDRAARDLQAAFREFETWEHADV